MSCPGVQKSDTCQPCHPQECVSPGSASTRVPGQLFPGHGCGLGLERAT